MSWDFVLGAGIGAGVASIAVHQLWRRRMQVVSQFLTELQSKIRAVREAR